MSVTTTPIVATVPVKSAWASKINWGELVKVVAILSAVWGHPIPDDVQANATIIVQSIVTVITLAGGIYTFVVRTYFSASVLPQSLPTPPKGP